MAKIDIPCLISRTAQSGVTSWYWQPSRTLRAAGWEPVALGKDRAAAVRIAEARNEEVDAWKNGGKIPRGIRARSATGTFGALIDRYRRDIVHGTKPSGAPRLKPRTRIVYETGLKRLETWGGKHPLAFITPARVRALRDATARPIAKGGIGHAAAHNLLKVGRQVFAFGENIDAIPKGANPFANFDLAAPPPRSASWSEEDQAAFVAAAYELGYPSMALAIELAIYTAQRESDLIAFTEPQFQALRIHNPAVHERLAGDDGIVRGWVFAQIKTTTEYAERLMEIPFEPEIRAKVEAAIRTNRARDRAATPPRLITHVLVNDATGLPWNQRHFIRTWSKIADHAAKRTGRDGMRKLVWHDLRRTRVVRLRRHGHDKTTISAITGLDPKSIDEMLKIYGPIDPTITAAAIAGTLGPRAAKVVAIDKEEKEG